MLLKKDILIFQFDFEFTSYIVEPLLRYFEDQEELLLYPVPKIT